MARRGGSRAARRVRACLGGGRGRTRRGRVGEELGEERRGGRGRGGRRAGGGGGTEAAAAAAAERGCEPPRC